MSSSIQDRSTSMMCAKRSCIERQEKSNSRLHSSGVSFSAASNSFSRAFQV